MHQKPEKTSEGPNLLAGMIVNCSKLAFSSEEYFTLRERVSNSIKTLFFQCHMVVFRL